MDLISKLSDDLLLKILSLLPIQDAIATSLLSNRWRFVWKQVPKLVYADSNTEKALSFINKFLQLNKAPVLHTLHLRLGTNVPHLEIEKWIDVAISRHVCDLKFIQYRPSSGHVKVPKSLYTCHSLVNLHLQEAEIADLPLDINFPSLKNLTLVLVKYSSDEVFSSLLSSCPVLEKLVMCRRFRDEKMKTFKIAVPWLQRLDIFYIKDESQDQENGDVMFMINAPCLKSLKIFERISKFCLEVNMPELVEAEIDIKHGDPKKLMGCLTSAKHLSLCLKPPMDQNPIDDYNQLVSLELCITCASDWLNLILRRSPNMRNLSFKRKCCRSSSDVQTNWEQPSYVPECLISSLETVEWIGYKGTEEEKNVVTYLLENGCVLKTMTILSKISTELEEKQKWVMDLESKTRSSSDCLFSLT